MAAPVFSAIAATAVQRLDITPAKHTPSFDTANLLPFFGDDHSAAGGASAARDDGSDTSPSDEASNTDSDVTGSGQTVASSGVAPDFQGESLRSALSIARARGVTVVVRGAGYVIKQVPAAGVALDGRAVKLILSDGAGAANMPVSSPERDVRDGLRGHG